jgi:hypothetical protein
VGSLRSDQWKWIGTGLFATAIVLRVLIRAQVVAEVTSWQILAGFVALAGVYWLLTRDRYRDYVFEPMRADELPGDTHAAFDQGTPEFMQLGCGLVGDFRLAYFPRPTFARYFLPQDRRMYGEVSDYDGTFCPSFTTIFEDGRFLETACLEGAQSKFDSDSRLWMQVADRMSIDALFEQHRRMVDTYEANMQVRALIPTASNLGEFAQYGHRLVWWETRVCKFGIPEPELPRAELAPLKQSQPALTSV